MGKSEGTIIFGGPGSFSAFKTLFAPLQGQVASSHQDSCCLERKALQDLKNVQLTA